MQLHFSTIIIFCLVSILNLGILSTTTFAEDIQAKVESNSQTKNESSQTPPSTLKQKLDYVLPNQKDLFDSSSKLNDLKSSNRTSSKKSLFRLADGDLEEDIVPRLLNILMFISGTIFFVFFSYAGIRLLLAYDDEEALSRTKSLIIQGIIGSVLIAGALGIVTGIVAFFSSLS